MRITLALLLVTLPAAAQSARTFTVDDLLEVTNVAVADLSDDGRWLAATATTLRDRIGIDNHRFGDPTYVAPAKSDVWIIDTRSGERRKLFPEKRQVRGLRWSPDGSRLALLALEGDLFAPMIWEREGGRFQKLNPPAGQEIADNADFQWTPDGRSLILPLRPAGWRAQARQRFVSLTSAPVVVQSSKADPLLAWIDLRQMAQRRSVAVYQIASGQTREIVPAATLHGYDLSEDGAALRYLESINKKTDYDNIANAESQVRVVNPAGGEPRTILNSNKGLSLLWSGDGRRYAYSKDGDIFTGAVDDKEPRQLTGKKEKDEPKADAKEPEKKDRLTAVRLSQRGDYLVVSNKDGLWLMDTATAAKDLMVKMPEDAKEGLRYQALAFSPDAAYVYLTFSSRTRWERGVSRYHRQAKRLEKIFDTGRLQSGLRLSKDGKWFVFQSADSNRPADLYIADAEFTSIRRLTDANPQLARISLSRTELVAYLDVDGNRNYGVLYYPVGYEPGKKYPAVFNIYEQFFDDSFQGTLNVLTANGYAVMQPSVTFETGFPGEAWMKSVTAAANKLIETGVADPDRLGVQGTSYGGYATNLLITQTNRFKAAINISGKVNMVSFYTDSPRLGVRNTHAPEKSQDRLGATLWQQPQKYLQHSAIMFADRIKTPLLLLTGEQDHNVPARQAMEMYYALRRLGKEVEWVSYTHGGHGMPTTTVEEVRDYHQRILKWYEQHLKKAPAKKEGTESSGQGF